MSTTHRASTTAQTLGILAAIAAVLAAALTAGATPTVSRSGASAAASTTLSTGSIVSTGSTVSTQSMSTVAAKKKLTHKQLFRAHIVTATNKARKAHHLKPLSVTKCLTGFAAPWAKHMANHRGLSHQSLGPFLSHCNANYAAENVASGNVTGAQVVTMWLNSPEHRANLLSKHYTHVAIGAAKAGNSWYVVQDFSN